MSETYYLAFCTACQNVMEIASVTDEWIDGRAATGRHVCSRCGKTWGVWIDGGEIDLETVRHSNLNPANDFEVFTEEPWRT